VLNAEPVALGGQFGEGLAAGHAQGDQVKSG
jgi:hypothetical protein